jgi:bacterioferritin-associated ferredoxin
MCRDFNEQVDPDKKLEMIEHLESVVTYTDYGTDCGRCARLEKLNRLK